MTSDTGNHAAPVPVPAGVLAPLLAPPVVVVDVFDDGTGSVPLFSAEAAAVAGAVVKRRREFAAVRRCARTALAHLGVPAVLLLPGPRGAPHWPEGVVGSMTHCPGYRAAAVAPRAAVAALGIDAEPARPLDDPGVLALMTDAGERAALGLLAAGHPRIPWGRLMFSAKEAVYKAWYPLTGRPLGFRDVRVRLASDGTFAASPLVPVPRAGGVPPAGFHGRWLIRSGLVVTAVVLPAQPAASASRDALRPTDGPSDTAHLSPRFGRMGSLS